MRAGLIAALIVSIAGPAFAQEPAAAQFQDQLQQLKSSDKQIRGYAAYVLGKKRGRAAAAVPALIEALDDPADNVRGSVIIALGEIGSPARPAVPALARILRQDKGPLGTLAGTALASIGADWGDLIRQKEMSADEVFACLRRAGPEAIGSLAVLAQDPDPDLACWAVDALGGLNDQALPGIIQTWAHRHPRVRKEARDALLHLAERYVPLDFQEEGATLAVDALLLLSRDRDAHVRRRALAAMPNFGRFNEPVLLLALRDPDATTRRAVCDVLRDRRAVAAVIPLTECLQDKDARVRVAAAAALWNIDANAPRILPTLQSALEDAEPEIRAEAVTLLGNMGVAARGLEPALDRLRFGDRDGAVRAAAEEARINLLVASP